MGAQVGLWYLQMRVIAATEWQCYSRVLRRYGKLGLGVTFRVACSGSSFTFWRQRSVLVRLQKGLLYGAPCLDGAEGVLVTDCSASFQASHQGIAPSRIVDTRIADKNLYFV